jgi:hypothetical protein
MDHLQLLQLISASEDGSVALIDRRIRKVLKRLHFTKGTYPMCMKPSGRTLYVGDKVLFVSAGLFLTQDERERCTIWC